MRTPTYTTRVDVADATTTYVGNAAVGASQAAAVWRIFRLTSLVGGGLVIEYADGDANFENIWNNRTSLTYS